MKYRYIKVNGNMLWGEAELTKEMLQMVASGKYDTIIDLQNMTYFDADANEWKDIDGSLSK